MGIQIKLYLGLGDDLGLNVGCGRESNIVCRDSVKLLKYHKYGGANVLKCKNKTLKIQSSEKNELCKNIYNSYKLNRILK